MDPCPGNCVGLRIMSGLPRHYVQVLNVGTVHVYFSILIKKLCKLNVWQSDSFA